MITPIEKIRAACIAAHGGYGADGSAKTHRVYQLAAEKDAARLADVLLAIEKKSGEYYVGSDGRFCRLQIFANGGVALEWIKQSNKVMAVTWDLRQDDLTSQSLETVEFIASLL